MRRTNALVLPVLTSLLALCLSTVAIAQDADPVAEAAKMIGLTSGGDASDTTSEETPDITVSPQGTVEMHVRELSLSSVLQMLSMQSRRNIIATPAVTGEVTANLYGVTFEEALTAVLDSNNCGWRERGNFIYVYTNDQLNEMESQKHRPVTRIFRLRYARAEDVNTLIQGALSEDGVISVSTASESGVASSAEEAGGNAMATEDVLVVTDYPERLEAIAALIAEIDVRPQQVMIEATILRAGLTEDNALGIDFNVVGGVDFQEIDATSPGITDLLTGQLPPSEFDNTSITTRTDFNQNIPGGGFTFGVIKNSVAAFVRALDSITDVNVLANPKVLALNKHRGEVIVGRRDGYLTTTVTETAAVQSVEFLETGTQLIFRPFIGDDGYIRMEVHPEDSTGGITAANLPFEQTTEVTTNLLCRDGNTILIGGLFREVTSAGRSQIPLLGNIPIAGALGRSTNDSTQREEVIILLTVRLIKDDGVLEELSADATQDVERYRVGMRQGLQWFGRERLSQAHYHWALEHLSAGHMSRALWDLDLSINNNPKMLAAIKLKEKLLDQRQWEEESSRTRTFLHDQIMRDQGIITPPFGRPGPPMEFPALEGPSGFDTRELEGEPLGAVIQPPVYGPVNEPGKGES